MPIPSDLKPHYEQLRTDLIDLFFRWIAIKNLYSHSQERLDLLNETAPNFFSELQQLLIRDLILGIARITDPPQTCGRDNLTLPRLAGDIDPQAHPQLHNQVAAGVNKAKQAAGPARNYRHRLLAHRDLGVALGSMPPGVTFKDLRVALEQCALVLNIIQLHFGEGTTIYERGIESLQGVPALMSALQRSVVLKEMLEAREVSWERVRKHRLGSA